MRVVSRAWINSWFELKLIISLIHSAWIELELNWKILNWNWIGIENLNWPELIDFNSAPYFSSLINIFVWHSIERAVWQTIPSQAGMIKQTHMHHPSTGYAGVFGHEGLTITLRYFQSESSGLTHEVLVTYKGQQLLSFLWWHIASDDSLPIIW